MCTEPYRHILQMSLNRCNSMFHLPVLFYLSTLFVAGTCLMSKFSMISFKDIDFIYLSYNSQYTFGQRTIMLNIVVIPFYSDCFYMCHSEICIFSVYIKARNKTFDRLLRCCHWIKSYLF